MPSPSLPSPPPPPPRLYIVTDRSATGGRPLAEVVAQALAGARGAQVPVAVQLREKDLPARPLLALARALRAVTRQAGAALYVNDRVDVALAVGADGVHLGGGALAPADVRAIAPRLAIAISTHAANEVVAAAREGLASFAVFGPVFDTPSKRALGAPQGLDALAAAARGRLPVLALGGVTPATAGACLAAGASGVAVIRGVIAARDPGAAVRMFLRCFKLH